MSKRNIVRVPVLSVFALTIVCLLSAVITAQKGPQGTTGTPVKGIDVIVQKNPGNTAVRTGTTDEKGEVKFVGLAPGNYSLTIVDPSKQEKGIKSASVGGETDRNYLVKIDGVAGGSIEREWNVREGKFAALSNATARGTAVPTYDEKIGFEIGSGNPPPVITVDLSISKSRSNVKGNAANNLPSLNPTVSQYLR